MKVYIYDKYLERMDKLCEARRGSAEHLAQLWVNEFNKVNAERRDYAIVTHEKELGEPEKIVIEIRERWSSPVGM